jgi:cell wall-associated protease
MKRLITLATLLQLGVANASLVAIMDSGTDISHKDLAPKVWTNVNEKEGSTVDLDNDGLPGDVHGWDFTEGEEGSLGSPNPFNDKYVSLITPDVTKFYTLYAKYEAKTISEDELKWLKTFISDKENANIVDFIGNYSHGTHVAGAAVLDNPNAKVLGLKVLATVYKPVTDDSKDESKDESKDDSGSTPQGPALTVEEFKKKIVEAGTNEAEEMVPMATLLNFHKADVVNQSFGIGFEQAVTIVGNAFVAAVQRKPTQAELVDSIVSFVVALQKGGTKMFNAAPNTLFVVAAGNDSSDNDKYPDFPASVKASNKIAVAATNGYSELAEFSNFGATKVDVAAPGVGILSTAPAQTYMYMSGTSQAAPFVTNAIALAKDANSKLTAADIKSIILGTVDVKDWLKGKVATSGIVNKARVVRAAELSKTLSVAAAINQAKTEVADVAVPKSFARRLPGMKLDYKPIRPSLMVKIPGL